MYLTKKVDSFQTKCKKKCSACPENLSYINHFLYWHRRLQSLVYDWHPCMSTLSLIEFIKFIPLFLLYFYNIRWGSHQWCGIGRRRGRLDKKYSSLKFKISFLKYLKNGGMWSPMKIVVLVGEGVKKPPNSCVVSLNWGGGRGQPPITKQAIGCVTSQ